MINLITILLFSQLDHFGFATIPSPQTAGTPFQITVYAYDSLNNLVNFNGPATIFTTPGPQYGDTIVTFSSGVWQGQFTATLASNYTLSCQDYNVPPHIGESNSVLFNPNVDYKLLAILPGQIYIPGIIAGKAGSVTPQSAGVYFNIEVYYTDQWSNLINTGNDSCQITSTDAFAVPQGFTLNNGTDTASFACRTAGQHNLYTSDITNPSIKTDTSSQVNIYAGEYSKLIIILPGETHLPGDSSSTTSQTPGKADEPEDQYVNESFTVTVYATDSMWNKTLTSGNQVQLYSDFPFSNPPPASLDSGEVQFTLDFWQFGDNQNLWAENDDTISYRNILNILVRVDTSVVPDSFLAYPNPMGIGSNIMCFAYYLSQQCDIILAIYDPFGNLVYKKTLNAGEEGARGGINRLIWNGLNDKGERAASGLYYAVIKGHTHTQTIFECEMKVGVVW